MTEKRGRTRGQAISTGLKYHDQIAGEALCAETQRLATSHWDEAVWNPSLQDQQSEPIGNGYKKRL